MPNIRGPQRASSNPILKNRQSPVVRNRPVAQAYGVTADGFTDILSGPPVFVSNRLELQDFLLSKLDDSHRNPR